MNNKTLLAIIVGCFMTSIGQAQEAGDYRLPTAIQPTMQSIILRVDPAQTAYSGQVEIQLTIDATVERIGIHQLGLNMTAITLSEGDNARRLQAEEGDWEINWLSDGSPIEAGQYQLSIIFDGQHSTDSLGMHRVTFEGNEYIFTHFETMHARRAMPLFDEPSFKIPYQLTIVTPEGHTVVGNTPVASQGVEDGWQRVEFMRSKPTPGYLIAYAVGPLDRVPLRGMSVAGFIYTPKGRADKVGFVQRETPKLVSALEDYFGTDYPYRKLDFLAVPEFAIGAMENPGLITFRTDYLMLGDEAEGSTAEAALSTIAHEVAHMWFGDLVSIQWWNDMWLKEAFASWMDTKTLDRIYPQFEAGLKLPQAESLATDQQTTTMAIRRTVRSSRDVNADIRLNYAKGSALLGMLEDYVGADVWQQGVRIYMKAHAWGNAAETDLWEAMSKASGIDIGAIASTYLNQPGFAILDIDADGNVGQKRYLTYGMQAPDFEWRIPLSIKYKQNGEVRRTSYLLEEKAGRIDVPEDADWVFPDAGANGYFRWQIDSRQFQALLDDVGELTNREKIALLDNSSALLMAGRQSVAEHMFVVDSLLKDNHPLVFLKALEQLKWVADRFVDPSNADSFARLVDEKLSDRFREVGPETRPGDSQTLIQMRPRLLRVLGEYGSDTNVRAAAVVIAERYLESPESVGGDLGREALRVLALNDDGARYEQYVETYLQSDSEDQKSKILGSIYFASGNVIQKHLDFSISAAVPAGDAPKGIVAYAGLLESHASLYKWLEANLDAYEAKITADYRPRLPQFMAGKCSDENLALMQKFFADRGEVYAVSLGKAVEKMRTCIGLRQRESAAMLEFLEQYAD